jgi:hypothetical protein
MVCLFTLASFYKSSNYCLVTTIGVMLACLEDRDFSCRAWLDVFLGLIIVGLGLQ